MRVALAEDGVLAVEIRLGELRDEELGAVGVGAGVRHGEAAGNVEVEVGGGFVVEEVAGVAGAVSGVVAALDHEAGDDTMEGSAVIEVLVVHLLLRDRVGPILGALGEADEVGDGEGGLVGEELAGHAAHGGVKDNGGAVGERGGAESGGLAGRVWELRVGGLLLRGLGFGGEGVRGIRRRRCGWGSRLREGCG